MKQKSTSKGSTIQPVLGYFSLKNTGAGTNRQDFRYTGWLARVSSIATLHWYRNDVCSWYGQVYIIVSTICTADKSIADEGQGCRAIERFLDHPAALPGTSLAFVYCSCTGRSKVNSADTAINLLIRQLAQVNGQDQLALPVAAHYAQQHKGAETAQLTEPEQKRLLQEIFALGTETRIIIDALDECEDWERLLTLLNDRVGYHRDDLKLFFTSRAEVDVNSYLGSHELSGEIKTREVVPHVLVSHLTEDDMEQFIRTEVLGRQRRLLNGKYPEMEERLKKALLDRAEGM